MTSLDSNPQKQIEIEAQNAQNNDPSPKSGITFAGAKCKAIDFDWENLRVTASISKKVIENGKKVTQKSEKVILNDISGSIKHNKFTAIMGPSGCGKTTLLNVLSGRTESRLKITGSLRVNSKPVNDIEFIGNLVAFVQQDDILMATITPREVFTFTANLRLKLSHAEKKERVENLIKDLGLERCADTKVGNTFIRGLSGGERKRASIGVELITNPSLLFLDEPTTGLDSTTALNVLELLKRLAQNGRNVVSTIHQPSSEIFSQFDNLLLMVRGNIIYQGRASLAVGYFGSIGYPCPKLSNPADFFMKLTNESGLVLEEMSQSKDGRVIDINQEELESRFQLRVDDLVTKYNKSHMKENALQGITNEYIENKRKYEVSWFRQFYLVLIRALINEIRNPLDVKSKFGQILFFSVLTVALYTPLSKNFVGIQDRIGAIFLGVGMTGMAAINGSLGTFSLERAVFIRERMSKSYTSSAYFCGRALSELPLFIIFPFLYGVIIYFALELNLDSAGKFFIFVALHMLGWWAGSGYGLFLSTIFPTLEIALALVPVLIIPFFILAGFFVNQDSIPVWLIEFEYLSVFKWLFQSLALNEFTDLTLNCSPSCKPLQTLGFDESLAACIGGLVGIGVLFRILAFFGLIKISTPRTAKLNQEQKDKAKPLGNQPAGTDQVINQNLTGAPAVVTEKENQ